jgi:3-deoxy-manno-octulosonate cytidylyltransferase (CMP-KDO synthetase)
MASTRFPGKPLVPLCGKPMILHVIDRCRESQLNVPIFVATDSKEIVDVVCAYGVEVVFTGIHPTGTDRVVEFNEELNFDFLINVQGDEPVFNPNDISRFFSEFVKGRFGVATGYTEITDMKDFNDPNTLKVVVGARGNLIYVSRSPIPGSKDGKVPGALRQVCLYGYSRDALKKYKMMPRSRNEIIEDHEILRFIDNEFPVGAIELSSDSFPVDVHSDIEFVEKILSKKYN